MAAVLFYEKPGCANNARQKRLLQDAGHELTVRNLLETPWTPEELRAFFGARPVAEWFNRAAPRVRSGEIVPEALDEAEALALMVEDPLLIRRPLIEAGERREAGFEAERIAAWIGLSPAAEGSGNLEHCRRAEACPAPEPAPGTKPPHSRAAALEAVLAYHERSKHRLDRYAAGPETLDWSSQPDPFRRFEDAPAIPLPLAAERLTTPYAALAEPGAVAPWPLSLESLGFLLELSLGLSAWKEYGPDRWALRCNPSSGNLHPTEGYVISRGVPDLADGVYHYRSRDHALEQRALAPEAAGVGPPRAWLALSSIHWREAWKYGERAFRYCQLDTGHAIGSLRYAAAALGWRLRWLDGIGSAELAARLGLDRTADFSGAEGEEPELLLELIADPGVPAEAPPDFGGLSWRGRANVLDPHPMYHWPVIDEVAAATRGCGAGLCPEAPDPYPPLPAGSSEPAAALIRQRRSAQQFDRRQVLGAAAFHRLLDALLPRAGGVPFDVWTPAPRLHPVLFVHRVEGLAPGLYALPRRAAVEPVLKAACNPEFAWTRPAGCPDHLPLFLLAEADCGKLARTLHCHQAIAADSAFALGMLAEFETVLAPAPGRYRHLYWEAGLLGQALYLEAEALGIRGTGIGCYFDEAFHELLGLSGREFQSLYHFTVGFPLTDTRILTLPPYAGRISPTPSGESNHA